MLRQTRRACARPAIPENSHDPGDAAERPPCWLGGIMALAILVLCIGGFAMLVWG